MRSFFRFGTSLKKKGAVQLNILSMEYKIPTHQFFRVVEQSKIP